jgi:hypothetical protein
MNARRLVLGLGVGALLSLGGVARALPGGTIAITDHAIDPNAGNLDKELKKVKKDALAKTGEGWHIYFVAYLNKKPGAGDINFVLYPLDEKGGIKKGEQPNAFPVQTQPSATIVMSDLEVSKEAGINAGKYEVRITRLVGGKEVVFAKARLTLVDK